MSLIRGALAGALFVLSVSNAVAADAPPLQRDIQVTLSYFAFTPDVLQLQRNESYAIHLTNTSSGTHSFSAPEFFAAVTVAPQDQAKIVNGKIELPAGQTVDITVTPVTAGHYPIECTHFLHAAFGMRGEALIN